MPSLSAIISISVSPPFFSTLFLSCCLAKVTDFQLQPAPDLTHQGAITTYLAGSSVLQRSLGVEVEHSSEITVGLGPLALCTHANDVTLDIDNYSNIRAPNLRDIFSKYMQPWPPVSSESFTFTIVSSQAAFSF